VVSIGGGGTIAGIEKVRGKKRIEKEAMGRQIDGVCIEHG
jgi:hypothetical protein